MHEVVAKLLRGAMVLALSSCSGEDGSSSVSTGVSGSGGSTVPTITGLVLPSAPYYAAIGNGELVWADRDRYVSLKKASLTGGVITPLAIHRAHTSGTTTQDALHICLCHEAEA